jgi:hypothetical protein
VSVCARVLGLALLAILATGSQAAARSLTLQKVEVEKRYVQGGEGNGWTIPDGGGYTQWDASFGEAMYTFPVPKTIPESGATFQMLVQATAKDNNSFSAYVDIRGGLVKDGGVQVQAHAEPGKGDSQSKTVELLPSQDGSASPTVQVHVTDGPYFTYTYAAADEGPNPACGGAARRAHTSAINEVRVTAVVPGVQFHKAGFAAGVWCDVTKDMVLKQGDEISCDPDGSVTLAFADNSTVVLHNTTQLKIASFFTEGGVVRTEILLKMGEVAAQVNKSEATKSDFRIQTQAGAGTTRGTTFNTFYDPGSRSAIFSTYEGTLEVDPAARGLPTRLVGAGKEVEVTPRHITALAAIGKAGARGGVNRLTARDRVLKVIARHQDACKTTTPRTNAFSVEPGPAGWRVGVKLSGKLRGTSRWTVRHGRVAAANAIARKLKRSCR